MMPNEKLEARITSQWGKIGFQGKDPATDFRGMGLLGLDDLFHLSKMHPDTCQRILSSSHHVSSGFSMAIVGINLTDLALNLVRTREVQYHFYVNGATKEMYHEFYCEFFFRMLEMIFIL